jgi:hypothetical protein
MPTQKRAGDEEEEEVEEEEEDDDELGAAQGVGCGMCSARRSCTSRQSSTVVQRGCKKGGEKNNVN